jgi:Flp pilus assembly protein TadD
VFAGRNGKLGGNSSGVRAMKDRVLHLGLAAILLFSVLPALAQRPAPRAVGGGNTNGPPPTVTLEGNVRAADNETPLEHIRVELHHLGGAIMGTTFTGGSGEFSFYGISGGDYVLVVEQDGYEPLRQQLQVSDSLTASGVLLFLHRLEGSRSTAPTGTVSARRLGLPAKVQQDFEQGLAELYDKNKPEASLPLFARVIAKAPKFDEAYYETGVAYRKLKRDQEAETALRKAIELSENHSAKSQITLASLFVDEGKFADAEALARQVLATVPENWAANYELARALMGQHRTDEAEKSILEALKAKPDISEAYLLLANIHMNRNDQASLIKDLDNFLRLDPKGPQSDKAREMRDRTITELGQAKAAGTPPAPPQ